MPVSASIGLPGKGLVSLLPKPATVGNTPRVCDARISRMASNGLVYGSLVGSINQNLYPAASSARYCAVVCWIRFS